MDELIRKQDAVEIAMEYCPDDDGSVGKDGDLRELLDELENLPPVQPKRGKWIWNGDTLDWERLHYCSECKEYALRDTDGKYEVLSGFCPHCGADMRGNEDGTD